MSSVLIVGCLGEKEDILRQVLSDKWIVYNALSGEEFFKIIDENKIDVVLCGLNKGEMDRLKLCKELKGGKYKNIPIILLVKDSEREDIHKGFEIGVGEYLVWPFSKEELDFRVQTQMKVSQFQNKIFDLEKSKILSVELANNCHDINNELMILKGVFNFLESEKTPSEKSRYVAMGMRSVDKIHKTLSKNVVSKK